ncbi:STAS domain-containing protein [Pseudoalteromonas phenolica]|uniref:STAS domain-containing protein n=1 Tax=Pseudoalteromonas phenolica TaxID=161398 RepID=A0A0S2K5G7_9GAMM|nr:STAS domain-containing protein [Pseudoalteromonas phenolica]ALO43526.1 hypothetical protein PP2015_3045 [Pseudoalteromonas phenolica]MBE0355312.1 hypothetical protein [Pseudoalteromonas phenolica O-BC30]TMO55392.1 STAS domain-containing protein [Pseudoalteromonas phenolica]|tara:strand:- start:209 stop:475 length:267 start_codon:yes stop_codon:yes gene_type:complete
MLKLPSELTISHVEEFHQQVLQVLHAEHDVSIDVSDVTRVDTASIQVLCALQKHLLDINNGIRWHGESQSLSKAVDELGLTELLALPA